MLKRTLAFLLALALVCALCPALGETEPVARDITSSCNYHPRGRPLLRPVHPLGGNHGGY